METHSIDVFFDWIQRLIVKKPNDLIQCYLLGIESIELSALDEYSKAAGRESEWKTIAKANIEFLRLYHKKEIMNSGPQFEVRMKWLEYLRGFISRDAWKHINKWDKSDLLSKKEIRDIIVNSYGGKGSIRRLSTELIHVQDVCGVEIRSLYDFGGKSGVSQNIVLTGYGDVTVYGSSVFSVLGLTGTDFRSVRYTYSEKLMEMIQSYHRDLEEYFSSEVYRRTRL